jgi:CRISPR system Cascade subunit CasD
VSTLLLRLAGPMQSWGTQSRFSVRDAGSEPSKSGVIGLLCAALGQPRDSDLTRLAALTMGVRVDRPGTVHREYQTAGAGYGVRTAEDKRGGTVLSNRYYLADACFLVGLEGPRTLLEQLDEALTRPRWPLYLGRKAFVPGVPVHFPAGPPGPGLRDVPLWDTLASAPCPIDGRAGRDRPSRARVVLDEAAAPAGTSALLEVRADVPLSFAQRRFTIRHVVTRQMELTTEGTDDVPVQTDPESP